MAATATNDKVWRIGDVVMPITPQVEADPWPERTAGKAFWYVAHCMAGLERRLAADIKALGFSAYVPMRTVLKRRPPRGRAVKAYYPLFPKYVFFETVPTPRCWVAIRELRDLVGILANNEAPVSVEDESIGDLMAAEDMRLFDETIGLPPALGDPVMITGGKWDGYHGVVEAKHAKRDKRTGEATMRARLTVVGKNGAQQVCVPLDLLRILA